MRISFFRKIALCVADTHVALSVNNATSSAARAVPTKCTCGSEGLSRVFDGHTNNFYCNVCSGKGDLISHLLESRGFDEEIDVIRHLLQTSSLPFHDPAEEILSPRIMLHYVAIFYHAAAMSSRNSPGAKYLVKRCGRLDIRRRFLLGCADAKPDALCRLATNEEIAVLVACGLAVVNTKNVTRDFFQRRVIFPLFNSTGSIVGFAGRLLPEFKGPKYINSRDSVMFDKSQLLYGHHTAQRSISHQNNAILVEGYLDVIALNAIGVLNVVAAMGTAVNTAHIESLLNDADVITVCFDGDAAGNAAASNLLTIATPLLQSSKSLRFVVLEDEDPDTAVSEKGSDYMKSRLESAIGIVEFAISELSCTMDLTTIYGAGKLIADLKPIWDLSSESDRELIIEQISAATSKHRPWLLAAFQGS